MCHPGTVKIYAHLSKKKRSKRKMGKAKKTKLNLNFKHSLNVTFTRNEIEQHFRSGWGELLDKAYKMISLVEGAEIRGSKRNFGLLHLYVWAPDELRQLAAEGIAWKIERLSAKVCEGCGKIGRRRTALRFPINFCIDCFTEYLSDIDDPLSRFLPGKSGLFNDE